MRRRLSRHQKVRIGESVARFWLKTSLTHLELFGEAAPLTPQARYLVRETISQGLWDWQLDDDDQVSSDVILEIATMAIDCAKTLLIAFPERYQAINSYFQEHPYDGEKP